MVRKVRMTMMRTMTSAALAVVGMSLAAAAQAQTFRVARTFSLSGSGPEALPVQAVLADIGSLAGPADGLMDVLVVQQNQLAAILFSKGDGTFTAGRNTELNDIPTGVAVGNFDADTLPDMLVVGTSKAAQFFRGTGGNPPFIAEGAPLPLDGSPILLASGFLNDDQKPDVAVLQDDGSGGMVQILIGNGDGTFAKFGEPFATGAGASGIAIGELTGDSFPDVAVTSAVSNNVLVLRNNGTGFLELPGATFSVGLEPVGLAVADLNSDGRNEIVSVNRSSDSVSVLLGNAAGGFASAIDLPSGGVGSYPSAVTTGDFNKDGHQDIFVANNRSSDVGILLGQSDGSFTTLRAFVADQEPVGILAADFNGDGSADPLSINVGSTSPNAAVILSRASGVVVAIEDIITEANPAALKGADVNGDAIADLIVTHASSGPSAPGYVQVYRSPGADGAPVLGPSLPVADPQGLASGDINGDGILDVVVLNGAPTSVVLFLGKRSGGFEAAASFPTGSAPSAFVVGDWNSDGRSDVAVSRVIPGATPAAEPTGAVEIRLGSSGGLSAATTVIVSANAVALDYGDFNEDQQLDLFIASGASAGSVLLLGNGTGGFASSGAPLSNINNIQVMAVGDFDRDQHDDVAVISGASNRRAVVLYGSGTGLFPARKELSLDSSPAGLIARDLTNDGLPDLLISDQASNELSVFRSLGGDRNFRSTRYRVSRLPTNVAAADFDGDGGYDGAAVTNFVGSVAVLSNDAVSPVHRGDGNGDTVVSAADVSALTRELGDGVVRRAEDVGRGNYPAAGGVDSNGDGSADGLDTLAVVHRLFNEL